MTTSKSAAETIALGRSLAARLRGGEVIALYGDLGAGKTCLVKGLAQGLGVTQAITSPTFTIVHEYPDGRLPLHHIDLYRLDAADEAIHIGIEDYLNTRGVTVIEWAEKIESLLPASTIRLRLEWVDDTTRRIEVT